MFNRLIAFAALILASHPATADTPPPIRAFFDKPLISSPVMSPDNRALAAIVRSEGAGSCVAVFALGDDRIQALRPASCIEGAEVSRVAWAGDDTLVFEAAEPRPPEGFSHPHLFAVDRDGKNVRALIAGTWTFKQGRTGSNLKSSILPADYRFLGAGPNSGARIVVEKLSFNHADHSLKGTTPFLFDVHTHQLSPVLSTAPAGDIRAWWWDRDWIPRAALRDVEGISTVFYNNPATGQWETLGEFADSNLKEAFQPAFFDFEGGLYVTFRGSEDTQGLYRFDLAKHAIAGDRIFDIKGFDFRGLPETDPKARKLLGFRYLGDSWATYWTDPGMAALQKKFDAHWPSTINAILCGNCLSDRYILVLQGSERLPGRLAVYDRQQDKYLPEQFLERDGIEPKQMGKRTFEHYAARDGLSIPVYVTRPAGTQGPFPTVVYLHGGPWLRGSGLEWRQIPQFLASRGYAVIEPEFRASTGYGARLFEAGLRQWGLKMQEDVADAARWAIDQHIADPARIALGGASYGGYATLMGLIENPELFRAGFEWVGVTDINLMYSVSWSDTSIDNLEYAMPRLIGDPATLAEQFARTSPIRRAAELHQPLLMAYGSLDRRVPIVQGTEFRDAVAKVNHDVEWVVYPDEGHGWHLLGTNLDFWGRVERFLARTLGPPAGATVRPGVAAQ